MNIKGVGNLLPRRLAIELCAHVSDFAGGTPDSIHHSSEHMFISIFIIDVLPLLHVDMRHIDLHRNGHRI